MRLPDHKMQGPRCGENSDTWHRTEPIPPVLRAPLRRSYLQDARKPERRSDLSRVTQEGSPERVLAAVLPRCPEWLCCCCLVAQLCLTLCHPRDCSPPGSSVHGIVQARILEWVTIFFSRGSSQCRDQTLISNIGRRILSTVPPGKPELYSVIYSV